MANPHWDFTLQLTPGTLAKAEDVNTNLAGIDAGFVSVTTDMDQALKVINGPGVVDINLNAAARANKIVSFDGAGGVLASIYIGNYRGNHAAAAGTVYNVRDTVKDSTGSLGQDNIYICNVSHTSTGTLSTDTANWDILVDVAAVAVSAAAALVSENNAAATYDLFDDRVLGAFTTANEPTLDNDGNALLVSAMYYNSDTLKWRSWTGSTWADQNLGLGISDSALATVLTILADATVSIAGEFEVINTSIENSQHATSIMKDAAGFSDAMALQISYMAGALAALADTSVINISIDRSTTVGGRVLALNVDATDGTAEAVAVSAGIGVDPIHQASGILINPTFASNNTTATDVPTMRDGNDGTTNGIMVNDNDYIIIGAAAAFSAMEISLTVISSKSIQAQYFYSITGTNQFTEFFPTDGTNGMQNSGVISWDLTSFVAHVADAVTGTFNIKITRTRNGSITNPVLGHSTTALAVLYSWDKDSILKVKSLITETINVESIYEKPPITAGSATVYTANVGISAYVTGTIYKVRIHTANTGSATIALDGLTARSIRIVGGFVTLAGEMPVNHIAELYDDGTNLVLLNPDSVITVSTVSSTVGGGSAPLNTSFDQLHGVLNKTLCHIQGPLLFGTVSSPTGLLTITGMPYPAATLSESGGIPRFSVSHEALGTAVALGIGGTMNQGTTIIDIFEVTTTTANFTVANKLQTNSTLYFDFTYRVR